MAFINKEFSICNCRLEKSSFTRNIKRHSTLIVVPTVGSCYSKKSAVSSNSNGSSAPNGSVAGLPASDVPELSYKMIFLNNVRPTDKHEEELVGGVDPEDGEMEKMPIINKIKNTSDG